MTDSAYRAAALVSLGLALPVALYFRARSQSTRERLDRRQEGLFILVGLRLCGLLILAAVLTWLVRPGWLSWSLVPLPDWTRVVGAVIGIAVVPPLLFWTFRSLGRNLTDTVVTRRDHTLVTHGPYRYVRHPFYGVVFLWGVSFVLLSSSLLIAVPFAAALALLAARTPTEEARLADRFGDDYRAYAARTGRYLPGFRGRG